MLQDSDTLFFGPRKHIQDLWALVDAQKKHILDLERQLCSAGVQPKQPHHNVPQSGNSGSADAS